MRKNIKRIADETKKFIECCEWVKNKGKKNKERGSILKKFHHIELKRD